MILWLDPTQNPALHGHPEACWVRTAQDAIEYLRMGIVTKIYLSYDLGDDALTGYAVACEIERRCQYGLMPCPQWEIISVNGPGSQRMAAAMISAQKASPPKEWETPGGTP